MLHETITNLAIGTPFTFAEIKQIIAEGNTRFANQTPPGNKDRETKRGMRQYGDLIIWKGILRYAKDSNRNILFITNDIKEDRVFTEDMKNDKMSINRKTMKLAIPEESCCVSSKRKRERIYGSYKRLSLSTCLKNNINPIRSSCHSMENLASFVMCLLSRNSIEK